MGGQDLNGREPDRALYICRAMYNESIHLGKVVKNGCDIAYNNQEIYITTFEVLFTRPSTVFGVRIGA